MVVKRGHGCLWAIAIVGGLLIVGGIILAVAAGNAVNELNKEQAAHAITKSQFDAVQLGISEAALETQLGKPPENTQEFVTKGILSGNQINSSCVYYNRVGQTFGSRYQFCFDNDSLTAKNAY